MTILPTPEQLAHEFVDVLRASMPADAWAEMRRRNALERMPDVCHSHDFCDANEAMDAALQLLNVNRTLDISALWSAAWDIAKRDHLTARNQEG